MANVIPKQFYEENGTIKISYEKDSVLSRSEMKELLEKILGEQFENIDYKKWQKTLTGCYKAKNNRIFFMMANITFMGGTEGQHPIDLKRIQYNVEWRNFYNDYKEEGKVIWMGVYSYKDLNIFAVFEPETYLKEHEEDEMKTKKGEKSNYSCHIFLNDLLKGYKDGIYFKKDKNNNHIWAISSNSLKDYFEGKKAENPIISLIKKINAEKIDWNRWIRADEAIPYIKGLESKTGLNKWALNMWSGWYLEGIYSEYLYNYPSEYIEYLETSKNDELKKEYKDYGLDLAFPNENYKFIGDLKNVCDDGGDTYLNDESNTKQALNKYNKIWFVIYIHEKKPGKTNDYEMVKWYNHYKKDNGRWDPTKEFNEMSAPNTPHSINMKEMIIVELNEVTEERYFTIKSQGKNSNGKPRPDKYSINKKLLKKKISTEEEFNEELFKVLKDDDGLVIYREKH